MMEIIIIMTNKITIIIAIVMTLMIIMLTMIMPIVVTIIIKMTMTIKVSVVAIINQFLANHQFSSDYRSFILICIVICDFFPDVVFYFF